MMWGDEEDKGTCVDCGTDYTGIYNDRVSETVWNHLKDKGLELPRAVCAYCANRRYAAFLRDKRKQYLNSVPSNPYACPKCNFREFDTGEMFVQARGIPITPPAAYLYFSVSCTACGFTEFYSGTVTSLEEIEERLAGL